jgi:16S rRNA (uracil1498-N3)-methyltransferase
VHPRDLDKLRRHVIEASKQCGRNVLMRVAPLTEWKDHVGQIDAAALRLAAHPGGEEIAYLRVQITDGRSRGVACAVGPEGGLTEEEVALARQAGWRVVSLGNRILRVETAALMMAVACGGVV